MAEKPEIQITDEFERALTAITSSRQPVLITGSAGTGKSTLLRHYCDNTDTEVVVLAPTGVAALNVRGPDHSPFLRLRH